ncbi:MAG: DNA polymerase III subunit gamma/tau, partial [Spirochaetaceae bacterium]|nr:DNA polymerase III subunit gamma/tau [Spirochaetaceae bacterium]
LQSGRIAHAYLFAGPRGTGKTSAARILARALNCPAGPTPEPCEDYDGSDEIAHGSAIDVIEIDGASNTSVNDIRQIKDEILFAPTTARYKIYIIDEVHMLSNSAFNALLKTIEEPPPYIVFIFATTEIHKVPATIRSRCQQFNFRLIPTDLIAGMVREAAADLEITADDGAVFWIAKEGTGSLRDAYTLFDQIASFSEGHITLEKIRDKLGLIGMDNLNDIAEAIADGDGQRLIELTTETLSRGVSVEQFVIDLAEYFRGVLFVRKGVHKETILGLAPDQFSGKLIRTLSDIQAERALELLLGLYRVIRYSLNPRFDLDLTVSRLAALRDFVTPQEVLQSIQDIRESM